ncbi:hypothetical protein, partial [Acinetobacter baumannii]|uniref:hypothetical protein n=1 Tax=Acinetobacter baumannii TaxID=470 RepID=UPI001C07247E
SQPRIDLFDLTLCVLGKQKKRGDPYEWTSLLSLTSFLFETSIGPRGQTCHTGKWSRKIPPNATKRFNGVQNRKEHKTTRWLLKGSR